jgi:hypothetical protein
MPRRVLLPPTLVSAPFSVTQALDAGIGSERLRSGDLQPPHAGVRVARSGTATAGIGDSHPGSASATVRRCTEYLPVLGRHHFFSHLTAARLWGCPLGMVLTERLYVSAVLPARAPRRRGISGHHAESSTGIVQRAGVPISDPVSTWLAISSLVSLDELVVAADHLVLDPYQLDPRDIRPFTSIEALRLAVGGFHGRGARRAASALYLVRGGAESRPETLLRLLLQRAGLPESLPNREVRDDAGRWLGRADLVYPEFRTVVEYDGDQHRSSRVQYEKDIIRWERFIEAGWRVVKVRAGGLFANPDATVLRVRSALIAGGWTS